MVTVTTKKNQKKFPEIIITKEIQERIQRIISSVGGIENLKPYHIRLILFEIVEWQKLSKSLAKYFRLYLNIPDEIIYKSNGHQIREIIFKHPQVNKTMNTINSSFEEISIHVYGSLQATKDYPVDFKGVDTTSIKEHLLLYIEILCTGQKIKEKVQGERILKMYEKLVQ